MINFIFIISVFLFHVKHIIGIKIKKCFSKKYLRILFGVKYKFVLSLIIFENTLIFM